MGKATEREPKCRALELILELFIYCESSSSRFFSEAVRPS
jgi:hypothetical protein